jgi:hypothetical protein
MLVRFTKNPPAAAADTLTCVRPDGVSTSADMARQGILPHEAFHFVLESTLGWHDAFFGEVARGDDLPAVASKLHDPRVAWPRLTQALQSESLIECLQTEQSAGAMDPATFAENLIAACRRRGVPPPDITPEELGRVRVGLREFGAVWRPLAPGASLERRFRAM